MKRSSLVLGAALMVLPLFTSAGWQDYLGDFLGGSEKTTKETTTGSQTVAGFSDSELSQAMKDALKQGVDAAIRQLGKNGGFLNDASVRIPLPDELQWAEKGLRTLKQDALADAFVESMNTAAEQAVPEATGIFVQAIKNMSARDVQAIIQGPDDAATQYFRQSSEQQLSARLKPLVTEATGKVGVTNYYKQMVDKAAFLQPFMNSQDMDLDSYVTQKTLDGLFLKIAAEEKLIRENPVQRSTDIMKKVFDYYLK